MNTSYKELILNDIEDLIANLGSLEKVWGDKMEVARKISINYYDCEVLGRRTGVTCFWMEVCTLTNGAAVQYAAYVEKDTLTHRIVELVGLVDEMEMEYDREIINTEKPLCDILTGRLGDWLMANIVSTFLMD